MLGIKAPFGEPFLYASQPMSKLMPENGAKKRGCAGHLEATSARTCAFLKHKPPST